MQQSALRSTLQLQNSTADARALPTSAPGLVQFEPGFRLSPIHFEKDDDTNFHMECIAGLANMRARNYSIPEVRPHFL